MRRVQCQATRVNRVDKNGCIVIHKTRNMNYMTSSGAAPTPNKGSYTIGGDKNRGDNGVVVSGVVADVVSSNQHTSTHQQPLTQQRDYYSTTNLPPYCINSHSTRK